ncbi:MAG: DUF4396 domain-containing protein [Bacteroidales bacterium]
MWNVLAWISVIMGVCSASYLGWLVYKKPEQMKIMNSVWVLTGLWASVLGAWAYFRFGKNGMEMPMPEMNKSEDKKGTMKMDMPMNMGMSMNAGKKMDMEMHSSKPLWEKAIVSSLHCGAGCTLADLIGETTGYFWLRHIPGWSIGWQWGLDYLLALLIGACFQYAAIHKMSGLGVGQTFLKAIKIDFLSLTAWQLGMYLFMYIVFFVSPGIVITANELVFWFIMQLAMLTGFVLAYPVNVILIKTGYKPSM